MAWSGIGRSVAVVALLMGTCTGVSAAQQQDVTGADNRAFVDRDATTEVVDEAKSIVTELFTYDYTDLAAHRDRFTELTTDPLTDRYDRLFKAVDDVAVKEKVTLHSEATDAAVRLLTHERAEVLVFLTQTSGHGDTGATTETKGMLLAEFKKVDGEWKASDLNLFEGK